MKVLLVNTCVRKESRTKVLADYLVSKLSAEVEEINVPLSGVKPLDETDLIRRTELISQKKFEDKMFDWAKDFAASDIIVIAAPYWDFSFPTWLKLYIEHINITGLVFKFSSKGEIIPLCKAKKLYYVTTKGGYNSDDFGYGYIKALANKLYGIEDTYLIAADGLDIFGNNSNGILDMAKVEIDKIIL